MSKRTTQPGSKPWRQSIVVFSIGVLFIHGVISSLVLRYSQCAQLGRVIDILLVGLLLAISSLWPLGTAAIRTRQELRTQPFLRYFILLLLTFCGWIILRGSTTGATGRETLLALLIDTSLFWLFFIIVTGGTFKRNRLNLKSAQLVGLLALAAVGLYVFGWHTHIDTWLGYGQCNSEAFLRVGGSSGWLRSRGFARNPNELGALLIIPLAVLTSRLRTVGGLRRRWLLLTLLGVISLLILTFSRSAWLVAGVALGSLFVLDAPFRSFLLQYKKLLAVVLAGALVALVAGATNSSLSNEILLHKSAGSNSTAQHLLLKTEGLRYVRIHPWGTGPGSAGAVGAALHDGPSIETESAYLDIAAQYGWLGLGLVLGLFGCLLDMLQKSLASEAPAVRAGLIGLLAGGLVIPIWSNLPVTMFVAIFCALAIADKD